MQFYMKKLERNRMHSSTILTIRLPMKSNGKRLDSWNVIIVIIHTSEKVGLPTNAIHLPEPSNKRERKRFRGNAPTDLQGGCPRKNLETRTKASINDKITKCRQNIFNYKKLESFKKDKKKICEGGWNFGQKQIQISPRLS